MFLFSLHNLSTRVSRDFEGFEKGLKVWGNYLANIYGAQFDSIPVNVVAVSQQQVAERPRRFEGRPPRT